jgi:uncharacterized protein (DUF1697 family)
MQTYISLLRAINVLGKHPIKMKDLKQLYEKLGFTQVQTYIQSGNVVFKSDSNNKSLLAVSITKAIREEYGYEVPVLVLDKAHLERVVNANPFTKQFSKDISFLHLTFLAGTPGQVDEEELRARLSGQEEMALTGEAVYLYCPHGYGRFRLDNNYLERKLGVRATSRNWKTTLKLLEMASMQDN